MSELSKEEIIKYTKNIINATYIEATDTDENGNIIEQGLVNQQVIQGLLDLYQKEKEKNKNWEKIYDEDQQHITNLNNRIFDLEADNKKLDKENQGLFELYNFNDTSLLAKILKDYKKEIKKLTPSPTNPIPLEKQNCYMNNIDLNKFYK